MAPTLGYDPYFSSVVFQSFQLNIQGAQWDLSILDTPELQRVLAPHNFLLLHLVLSPAAAAVC